MISINTNLLDSIVKGIIAGYKDYIDVRKEKKETMQISDAYAFVKSNHIEDQVYKHINQYVNIRKQNAGPSWKLLKFNTNEEQGKNKITFIFKNEKYFDDKNVTFGKNPLNDKEKKEKKYLKSLMEFNNGLDFKQIQLKSQESYQLDADSLLFKDINNENNHEGNIFAIITYGIDVISRQLNSAKLWIPNPSDNTAVMYYDLAEKLLNIIKSEELYIIDDKDLEVLKSDHDLDDIIVDPVYEFGFGIEEEMEFDKD